MQLQKYIKPEITLWFLMVLVYSGIFCLVAILFYESIHTAFLQDEGVFLTIAKNMNAGSVPYLDFFDHKPPGIYLFLSFLFHIGLNSLSELRISMIVVNLASAGFVYVIANKHKPNSGLFASFLFLFCGIFFQSLYIFSETPMALCLLIVYFLLIFNKSNSSTFLAGIALGLALIFKQTALINVLFIIFYYLLKKENIKISLLLLGIFACWFPIILYLFFNNGISQFIQQTIVYNFTSYPAEPVSLVFKELFNMIYHTLPLWILLGTFFLFNFKILKSFALLCGFILLPIPFFLIRHYEHYWLQILPFISIAGAISFQQILQYKINNFKYLAPKTILMFLFVLSFWSNFKYFQWFYKNEYNPKYQEQIKVANQLNATPGKYILAENQFTIFYYLSDKAPINKYLYITEINNRTENAEIKTVDQLSKTSDVIILWPIDPNFAYSKKLQEYILQNYKETDRSETLGLAIYQ